jgi:catalase
MSTKIPRDLTKEQAAPLTSGSRLVRLGGIGIVLLSVAGVFLYLGGWFTPNALTPARFADEFERVDGIYYR